MDFHLKSGNQEGTAAARSRMDLNQENGKTGRDGKGSGTAWAGSGRLCGIEGSRPARKSPTASRGERRAFRAAQVDALADEFRED